jgi:hypothetical protein
LIRIVTSRGLRGGVNLRSLASEDTADPTHDAAHRKNAFVVGEKYFANTSATIVPALEQSEVFHGFKGGSGIHRRERIENCLHSRFHGLRFCVLCGLDREHYWLGDCSVLDAE